MMKSQFDGAEIAAHGDVNGQVVEVTIEPAGEVNFFGWRIVNDGKVGYWPHNLYDTIEQAFDAAIKHLIPDAETVALTQPDEKDFESLNALLYCGGLSQDLETIPAVIDFHNQMQHASELLDLAKKKTVQDLAAATRDIVATRGPQSQLVVNLRKLAEAMEANFDVLIEITDRNVVTAASFLENFLL